MQLNPLALALSTAGGSRWTPLNLFFGGTQGLWYDINDDSTIFQDSAGTTLASWGDPVGRVNDKSGRGNNAVQSTAGSRPIRGRMPKRGRVNLLAATERFDGAYWTKNAVTVSADQSIAPDGTLTADKMIETTADASHFIQHGSVAVTSGVSYTLTVFAKAAERTWLRVTGNAGGLLGAAYYNLTTGALGTVAAGTTASITPVGNGWFRCVFTRAATSSTNVQCIYQVVNADAGTSYIGDGTSGIYIWGAQLETGSFATPYQHVIDSLGFNVTESGQPSCGYLSFNGSNQWMQTAASVDFSATDEMSLFAGVRKVSDAAVGIIGELSTSTGVNNGSFNIYAATAPSYVFGSRGTTRTEAIGATSAAPQFAALTGLGDISGDSSIVRYNGTQLASNTGDQGTGNYGNYVTYFGARAGTSLYFNGLMFSTIIRGALTSGTLLTRTEQYVARQTPTVNL